MEEKLNSRRCLFTHADAIRAMSDEELARFMAHYDSVTEMGEQLAYERWLDWLRQEAEE